MKTLPFLYLLFFISFATSGFSQDTQAYFSLKSSISSVPASCCDTLYKAECHIYYPAGDSLFSIFARIINPETQNVFFDYEIPVNQQISLPQNLGFEFVPGHAVLTWPSMILFDKEFEIKLRFAGNDTPVILNQQ